MLLKNIVVCLCLLGATAARFHILPRGSDVLQSLVGKAGAAADAVPNPLCELDDSGADPAPTPADAAPPCSDCKTIDGVLVNADPQSGLSPEDNVQPDGGVDTGAPLIPRTDGQAIPLLEPDQTKRVVALRQQEFMKKLKGQPGTQEIGIQPPKEQLDTWKSPSGVPIGATANWYSFEDKPSVWKMYGMTGCTAIFIVSEKGFWAGHFWESSLGVNGGSAFLRREALGQTILKEREDIPEFREVAVDIFTQPALPADVHWISLPKLKADYGDPFATPPLVYILTKAESVQEPNKPMYASKIKLLTDMLQKELTPAKLTVQTYVGVASGTGQTTVPAEFNGLSIVQYTPFQGEGAGCSQIAAVRIWAELNPKPIVEKQWEYIPPANKRLGRRVDACPLSDSGVTSTVPTPSPTNPSSPITSFPCLVYEGGDTIGAKCECSNGATISTVPPSGTNTGESYKACPWATLPPEALTTPAPPPRTTQTLQYPYTFTDAFGKVEECQGSSVGNAGGIPYTVCQGSSAMLYEKPQASMEVGQSQVLVGSSLTGPALMTTISSVLKAMCPTPTSPGAWTSCETGVRVLGEATWLNKQANPEPGDLTISIPNASYNTTDYRDMFIGLLASAANASAAGTNCFVRDWNIPVVLEPRCGEGCAPPGKPVKGTDTFCNMASFFDNQFYDGVQEQAKMWFTAEFGFELGELGEYSCDDTVTFIGDVLLAVLPEFQWAIESGIEIASTACALNDTLYPIIHPKPTGSKMRRSATLEIDGGK